MRSRPAFSSTAISCAWMPLTPSTQLLHLGRVGRDAAERAVERVEHGQQLLDEPVGGAIDERGLLAQDALAVVLEVGLHATQRVDELGPLHLQLARGRTRRRRRRPPPRRRRPRARRGSPLGSGTLLTGLVDDLGVGDLVVVRRRRTRGAARAAAGAPPAAPCWRLRRLVQPLREVLEHGGEVLVAPLDRLDVGTGEGVLQFLQRGLDLLLVFRRSPCRPAPSAASRSGRRGSRRCCAPPPPRAGHGPPRHATRRPSSCARSRPWRARCHR